MKIKQSYIDIKRENIKDVFDENAIYGLINRVAGQKYSAKIMLEKAEGDGFDFYEVFDKDDKVCIRANTGVSFARGFNAYLEEICHYSVGALSTSGVLPKNPPSVGKVLKNKSAFLYRYFYNYCTFCYTYAFDTWKEWEKTLDYLLLCGYNLILNPIGIESVWKKVLTKLGYSKKDIKDFLCGPAFYAWQWMMNQSGWAGGVPDSWYDYREKLAGKFNERLQSFGVGIVNAGYVGMVPDNFEKYYPDSNIIKQGEWFKYTRPGFIMPEDINYNKVANLYYTELSKIKGADNVKFYSVDPFHEGGISEGINLNTFISKNFEKMRSFSENAVWVLQEWGEPKKYISENIPDGGMLMLSLSAEQKDEKAKDQTGAPWCYCSVNYFGGQYYLAGDAYRSLLNPFLHLENNSSSIVGIGYMPESVNCGELIYSIYAKNSFGVKCEPEEFIREYTLKRYGSKDEVIIDAVRNMFFNLFNPDKKIGTSESGLCARPSLDVRNTSTWANYANPYNKQEELKDYVRVMLSFYDKLCAFDGYRNDLLEGARQLVSGLSWYFIEKIKESYTKKDINGVSFFGNELLELFDLQSSLLYTDKNHMLGTWLKKAKRHGKTPEEKAYFEWNARTLITLWGNKTASYYFRDYSAREWQGLLEDFYKPRWERFISRLQLSLLTGKKFLPADDYNEEVAFTFEKKNYPTTPKGNLKKAVEKILAKVSDVKIEDIEIVDETKTFEEKVMETLKDTTNN